MSDPTSYNPVRLFPKSGKEIKVPVQSASAASLRALDQVSAWLASLQVPIAKNRLSIYRKVLQQAEESEQTHAVHEFPPDAANAVHEVAELYQVWRGLQSVDDPILRQKFAKVVTGPAMLSDERPEKSEPKNTLFEVLIASYLKFCGVKIQFRDPDDVVARIRHCSRYFKNPKYRKCRISGKIGQ
jgi:hypothetical protein